MPKGWISSSGISNFLSSFTLQQFLLSFYYMLSTLLGSVFKGRGRKLFSKLIIIQKPGENKGTSHTYIWGRVTQPEVKEDAKTQRG